MSEIYSEAESPIETVRPVPVPQATLHGCTQSIPAASRAVFGADLTSRKSDSLSEIAAPRPAHAERS